MNTEMQQTEGKQTQPTPGAEILLGLEKPAESEPDSIQERLKKRVPVPEKEDETSEAQTSENVPGSDSDNDANGGDNLDATDDADSANNEQKTDDNDEKPGEESEAEGDQEDEGEPLVLLKELAEKLDLDASDLYEVQIPLGGKDGETISLGDLKDEFQAMKPLKARLDNIGQEAMQLYTDKTKQHNDLSQLVSFLPDGALSPEYMGEVTKQAQANAAEQTQQLLNIKPDWANPLTYQAAVNTMGATFESYGLSIQDLNNITDHRLILMVNDLATLKGEASEAARAAKKVPKTPSRRGKTPSKTAKAASKGKLAEKLRAKAAAGDPQAKTELTAQILLDN